MSNWDGIDRRIGHTSFEGKEKRKRANNWHLDKNVPIALIAVIVIQVFGFGWWGATVESRLGHLEKSLDAKTNDRFHRAEADAAHLLLETKIQFNRKTTDRIERVLTKIDGKIDRLIESKQ